MYYTDIPSPLGALCLTSDGTALTGLWLPTEEPQLLGMERNAQLPVFESAAAWLESYFAGVPGTVDFPLAPPGTAFQKRVWEILLTIPWGGSTSYGAIAKRLGVNMSAQAVGQAVGRNPISILIPCHRVLGAKGQLTGYAGGLEYKKWLLTHEGCSYKD